MNKLFTKIAKLFLGISMAAGVGVAVTTNSAVSVGATDTSFVAANQSWTNGENISGVTKSFADSNVTVTWNKGTAGTNTSYYTSGGVRTYGGSNFVISCSAGNLTSISITMTRPDNTITTDVGSYDDTTHVWTGSSASVTFSEDGSSGHRRISQIDATYSAQTTYTVTISVNNSDYGRVSSSSIANVAANTSISASDNVLTVGSNTVTATPTTSTTTNVYSFVSWTGIPAGGKVTQNIEVTANFSRTDYVPATGISLNESSISIEQGSSNQLTATVSPNTASDKSVTWDVSPTGAGVSVASDGTVSATDNATIGNYTVTATANGGSNVSATCTVSVTKSSLVTDQIVHSTTEENTGSTATSSWCSAFNVTGPTTTAVYRIYSMGTKGTNNAAQWNANGYLNCKTSAGKIKRITITTTADKNINIYGSNSAFGDSAPSGTALQTITAKSTGTTYTFQSDYSYFALKGTASSTSVVSISIVWQPQSQTITSSSESVEVGQTIAFYSDATTTVTWSIVTGSGTTATGAAITSAGVVSVTGAGTVTVKAAASGYADATKQVTFTAPAYSVSVSPTSFTAYRGQSQVLTATPSGLTPTKYVWTTSNANAAQLGNNIGSSSVETSGHQLTINVLSESADSATITVKAVDETNSRETSSVNCTVTITASTHSLTLSPSGAQSMAVKDTLNITATSNASGAYSSVSVTAETSDPSKVKVDGGTTSTKASGSAFTLSAIASGPATITFTTTNGDTETIAVNVEKQIYDDYELCTSVSDLVVGEHYIFVSANAQGSAYALSNHNNTNNRRTVSCTVANDLTVDVSKAASWSSDEIMVVTLGGEQDAYTFKTNNYKNSNNDNIGTQGYFVAPTTNSNNLYIDNPQTLGNTAKITITFDGNGIPTIKANEGNRTFLGYNSNNGSPIFSYYTLATTMAKVYMYKQVASTPTVKFNSSIDYIKYVGDTSQSVSATIRNPVGTEGAIKFSSSDEGVLEVDENTGDIETTGVGTATIFASATGAVSAEMEIRVLSAHTGLTQDDPLTAVEALNFADKLTGSDLEIEYFISGQITEYWDDDDIYELDNSDVQISEPTYADGYTQNMMIVGRNIIYKGLLQVDYENYCFINGEVVYIQLPAAVSISFESECDMSTKTYSSKSTAWNTAGLVVTALLADETSMDVSALVEWSFSVGTPSAVEFTSGTDITNYSLTVTASYQGKTASKTITGLTITFDGYVIYENESGWSLVTSVTELSAGDTIMIANNDSTYGMQSYVDGNNCGRSEITVSDNKVTNKGSSGEFVLESAGSTNTYYMKDGDNYLYAASNSSNHLKSTTKANAGDNGKWLFSYESTYMSIVAQGSNSRKDLRYNSDSTGLCFSAYATTSGCKHVQVYKKIGIHDVKDDLLTAISTFQGVFKCDSDGASFDTTNWNSGATTFESLKSTYVLNKIVAKDGGNPVEQFLSMYDYVIEKKNSGNLLYKDAEDFLGRYASGGIHANSKYVKPNPLSLITTNTNTIATIVIISMVSVTAIGGYFFLRKRKEQ